MKQNSQAESPHPGPLPQGERETLPFGPLKRFGLMGGSFDPVHVGHLSIAQQIFNALKLEKVILIPAATAPHKRENGMHAPAEDRMEMCRLAVHNMHGLEASDFELKRGGLSYTVETARQVRAAYGPAAEIYFLIGSDSLADLPMWYEIDELLTLARFAVAERRESPIKESLWKTLKEELGAEAVKMLRDGVANVQRVDISSTQIRELLARGEKIPGYLRRDVEEYIRKKKLYGAK
ncbi:MAG TPA: nicotinate (nicotinamide) nucleotide adenylyltransferase [Planctomycetota bacterium]|nr:nicotinate (nicotinamide) nucleotide adenylyltransferase [Planctomycetota bacterium]